MRVTLESVARLKNKKLISFIYSLIKFILAATTKMEKNIKEKVRDFFHKAMLDDGGYTYVKRILELPKNEENRKMLLEVTGLPSIPPQKQSFLESLRAALGDKPSLAILKRIVRYVFHSHLFELRFIVVSK